MKKIVGLWMLCLSFSAALSQVDTSYVYKTNTPYGTLDLRIAKSATRYYYLQENKTFTFRESAPGVKTGTYVDMTSWDSSPYTQGNLREKNGSADYFIMNYRLLFPVAYDPAYPEGYPLIIMMHGAGERGNCWDNSCYWADRNWRPLTNTPAAPTTATDRTLNNDHNLLHGGKVHLDARNLSAGRLPNDPAMPSRAFPGFIVFPQNLNGWDANTAQDAIRLVRLMLKKYKIDPNRVYVHGLSNGGYGTYEVVKRAPWLFAAALPMSGISDAGIANNAQVLADVANVPMWVFQGGIDTNPVPSKTKTTIKKLRDAGASVRYNEYSNLGHGVWNTAYAEPDFFTWILGKNKANIHTFANGETICLTNNQGLRMELAKGFRAYQWTFNGEVIAGATGPTYVANLPGEYRARFSRVANPTEAQWNRWSDPVAVSESNPAQAQVIQKGTVILKDLNNYNNAHLSAVGNFAHYYWYKDGVLQDLPGTQDDTTKNPVFKQGVCLNLPACTGNGKYTLVTAGSDNCPSPPSTPLQIYFNNQAPVAITAPATFTGTATGPATASVNWVDASGNESGFEIWRRKRLGTTTYSKWVMATLTTPNVTSFQDAGLDPGSVYQYKIRAVGAAGRSNYTPSASNQFLTVTTHADNLAPTTPQNLVATESAIREIRLVWEGSMDNTGIREYLIFFDEDTIHTVNAVTGYTLKNLDLNHEYEFTVKALDLGGNLSEASNPSSADTYVTGLYYEHSTGGWTDLDQINWNIAEYNGNVPNVTLALRTQEDYFNFEFEGYIYISTAGAYQFRTTSDDGSRLALNNVVIVENDGLHGDVTITSAIQNLESGPHLVNIKFFEATGGQKLVIQYKGADTGNLWQTVPDQAWRSGTAPVSLMAARMDTGEALTAAQSEPVWEIYPNPVRADEHVTITMKSEGLDAARIKVVSMMGESFYDNTFSATELNEGALISSQRRLQKGIYLLIIQQGERIIQQRLVVKD